MCVFCIYKLIISSKTKLELYQGVNKTTPIGNIARLSVRPSIRLYRSS